jgi:hypothetical protein
VGHVYSNAIEYSQRQCNQLKKDNFACGRTYDGMYWETRFNMFHQPYCDPSVRADGFARQSSCVMETADRSSGVLAKLSSIINDPKYNSISLAYLSFSNFKIKDQLCEAAKRGKNIDLILHVTDAAKDLAQSLARDCLEQTPNGPVNNVRVLGVGRDYNSTGGHLQHAKIFMASEFHRTPPMHKIDASAHNLVSTAKLWFTSSSANMSSHGTGIHFENWIFFNDKINSNLAQRNLCFFDSMFEAHEGVAAGTDRRDIFAGIYDNCVRQIRTRERRNIKFFVEPTNGPKAITKLEETLRASRELLVSIHRFGSWRIHNGVVDAINRLRNPGISGVIQDDDTLKFSVVNGYSINPQDNRPIDILSMNNSDLNAYRAQKNGGIKAKFMITEFDVYRQLFHNKFIVRDAHYYENGNRRRYRGQLFQGAGNFTNSALNIGRNGRGHYEHFYHIKIPGIVKAFRDAWVALDKMSVSRRNHPVGNNADK